MSDVEPGTRVKIHGAPYTGRIGRVVDPPNATSAHIWPLWVLLDNPLDRIELSPKGFNLDEVTPA